MCFVFVSQADKYTNVHYTVTGVEWGRLYDGLFLKSGMSCSDDVHAAHAQLAPPNPWEKAATYDYSFCKNTFQGKKVFFYNQSFCYTV